MLILLIIVSLLVFKFNCYFSFFVAIFSVVSGIRGGRLSLYDGQLPLYTIGVIGLIGMCVRDVVRCFNRLTVTAEVLAWVCMGKHYKLFLNDISTVDIVTNCPITKNRLQKIAWFGSKGANSKERPLRYVHVMTSDGEDYYFSSRNPQGFVIALSDLIRLRSVGK